MVDRSSSLPATSWLSKLASYRSAKDLREDVLRRFPALARPLERLAVLGAAELGLATLENCRKKGVAIAGLYDDNPAKQGTKLSGQDVLPTERLENLDRAIPVVIASHRLLGAQRKLKAMGFANVWPVPLLSILDRKAFPPHPFYDGLLEDLFKNRAVYAKLGAMFTDEKSKTVLDHLIGFRLTLDPEVLAPVVEGELYFPADIIRLGPEEVFVDGGAFTGDTLADLIDKTKGKFSRAFSFEPDPGSFEKLRLRYQGNKRITPLNAGLFSRDGKLRFNNDGTRNAAIGKSGGVTIATRSIDSVARGGRVSYIKMNIEGAEHAALKGAKSTIKKWRPRLACSVYHRPSDLWSLPRLVQSLGPSYKLYLRQHDGGIIESVLYAVASENNP